MHLAAWKQCTWPAELKEANGSTSQTSILIRNNVLEPSIAVSESPEIDSMKAWGPWRPASSSSQQTRHQIKRMNTDDLVNAVQEKIVKYQESMCLEDLDLLHEVNSEDEEAV